jgi:DNA-binding CsgD family transcriptional regulator
MPASPVLGEQSPTTYRHHMDQDSAADIIRKLAPKQVRLLKLVESGVSASKTLSRETGLQPASTDTHLQGAARILEAANRGNAAARLLELGGSVLNRFSIESGDHRARSGSTSL